MIKYISESAYFDVENGEEITKQNALKNYDKLNTIKTYNNEEVTEHNGYKYGTIKIKYWHECRTKRQLKLF